MDDAAAGSHAVNMQASFREMAGCPACDAGLCERCAVHAGGVRGGFTEVVVTE